MSSREDVRGLYTQLTYCSFKEAAASTGSTTRDYSKVIVVAMIITDKGHAMRLKNDSSTWSPALASDRLCSKDMALYATGVIPSTAGLRRRNWDETAGDYSGAQGLQLGRRCG